VKVQHRAAILEPSKLGELLRTIKGYQGYFVTQCALRMAPLVFVRPGELRHAEWSEINLESAEWSIPAEKMKMRQLHLVPLSKQVISILQELYPLTSRGQYVFPVSFYFFKFRIQLRPIWREVKWFFLGIIFS